MSLKALLEPSSIAVIGASPREGSLGHAVLLNLLERFPGRVYAVNPRGGEVRGLRFLRSLEELPPVELAVVLVPARDAAEVLERCRAEVAIVESAGFAEMGPEGEALQGRLVEIARRRGMRLLGPNCAGVVNVRHGLVTTFARPRELKPGPISMVTQAGIYVAGMIELYGHWGWDVFITLGNRADIDEAEAIALLADRPSTGVIGAYLEGASRGLLPALRRAARRKPAVVLWGGSGRWGRAATRSHTGSLAGAAALRSALLRQAGAIEARDLQELVGIVKVAGMQGVPGQGGMAVITLAGSLGVLALDALEDMEPARLAPRTRRALRDLAYPWTPSLNPLDLSFLARPDQYRRALEAMQDDPGVAAALIIAPALGLSDLARELASLERRKPVVVCAPLLEYAPEGMWRLEELGIPCFSTPRAAVRAICALRRWSIGWAQRGRREGEGA